MSISSPEDLAARLERSEFDRQKAERDLGRANDRLAELQAEFNSFAYAAGHDLREPLRTIGAYSQLLQNACKGTPEAADFLRYIKEAIVAANNLVGRLLTFSRAGTSTFRSTVDLGTVVQLALFSLSAAVTESSSSVTYENLHEANVNDSDLKLVFENLIDNSIKYRGGRTPIITIKSEERAEDVLVSVRDNGPGIEQQYRKDVLLPFKRLHGKEIPGAGLGLAISRKIIEAHGGELWVEDIGASEGAELCFTLPF